MDEWLGRTWGLSINELAIWLGVAGLVVAFLTLWHQVRSARKDHPKAPRGRRRRRGSPEQRYIAWFLDTYGTYHNPYLDRSESFELARTYIALTFAEASGGGGARSTPETRLVATDTIADRAGGHAFVIGDPGSGKSTLLKAFGLKVLDPDGVSVWLAPRIGLMRRRVPPPREVPILVPLRKFAKRRAAVDGLAGYVRADVLCAGAGLSQQEAAALLRDLVTQGRCVLLLDGLDEVATDQYEAVRDELLRFADDHTADLPTAQARLVVTCRRHNYLRIRPDWAATLGRRVFTLAPLRDSEIVEYVHRLRGQFKTPDGPSRYLAAVRASGTLDLHRTPLVLAMSVGLFAPQQNFDIPHSIFDLYQAMVKEMLERHWFRHDPLGAPNRFDTTDKQRLLREFALYAAGGPVGFDEFDRAALVSFASTLAPSLRRVKAGEVDDFVEEILNRSGLLSDTSDGEAITFVFAHRSIQEHLVADELLRPGRDGTKHLLAQATNLEWRQVIVFFTAAADQALVSPFLRELARHNVVLAGACLAGADCLDEVALPILDALAYRLRDRAELLPTLGALIAATGSPRPAVSEAAVVHIQRALSDLVENPAALAALGGDVEGVLRLLDVLAGSSAAQVAALVPRLARAVPDDPRLVEPLWRCLGTVGIEAHVAAASALVERLLTLAMGEECFAELQRQEPLVRDFLDEALRTRAYPFVRGHDRNSPLVALLAFAEYSGVSPSQPNRFFEAKAAGRRKFERLERDKRRTVTFSLFWPARVLSAAGAAVATVAAVVVLVTDWRVLYRPYGWWSIVIFLGPPVASFLLLFALVRYLPRKVGWKMTQGIRDARSIGHFIGLLGGIGDYSAVALSFLILPVVYAIASAPFAVKSLPAYVVIALGGSVLLGWFLIFDTFHRRRRYHLNRPSVFVDAYDDPRSRHWLVPATDHTPSRG